jgi:hypothetical protein
MKFRDKARNGFLLAALCGGTLLAGPNDPTELPPNPAVTVKATGANKLSLTEMLTHSGDLDLQVKADLRHVHHLQEVARKQKDVIKLNCVNDKLVELKAQANLFDKFHHELETMLTVDSPDRLTVYAGTLEGADSVHKARVGADSCAGEPELARESANGFEHPPFADDPTQGNPFQNPVEPPGYASPYN